MADLEFVAVGAAEEKALLALARAFHEEGSHPLTAHAARPPSA